MARVPPKPKMLASCPPDARDGEAALGEALAALFAHDEDERLREEAAVARAVAATTLMASPELTPWTALPNTLAARKPLKRSSCSGPTTCLTEISAETGTMLPLLART